MKTIRNIFIDFTSIKRYEESFVDIFENLKIFKNEELSTN
jgi:hypothetical protein